MGPNFGPGAGLGSTIGPGRDEPAQIAISGLSSAQVERLLDLIDTPKPSYKKLLGKDLWMLDSGASAPMVGDANLVHNFQKISLIAIGLPNGDCTMVRDVGSTTLGDGIKLDTCYMCPV